MEEKKQKVVLLLIILSIISQCLMAQPNKKLPDRTRDTSFILPTLLDSGLFINDLSKKINLKRAFDKFKNREIIGLYMYTFAINESGALLPRRYYNKNDKLMTKIQQFVTKYFNNYRWQAGYKKRCNSCKVTTYLQLLIHLDPDENNIDVTIKDIETEKNIFKYVFLYKL